MLHTRAYWRAGGSSLLPCQLIGHVLICCLMLLLLLLRLLLLRHLRRMLLNAQGLLMLLLLCMVCRHAFRAWRRCRIGARVASFARDGCVRSRGRWARS